MKKFLSLVLALVMTMSLVTVSAGAVDFTDDSDIDYKEAVDVISALGIVDGYSDDSFRPDGSLTRGAAAKIICNLILGPTTASALSATTAPFKDVPVTNTFAGYITYCAQQGIIGGYGDGTFRPTGTLTGNAFMKMLLGALGYDSSIEGYSGANWQVNVIKQAVGIGLDDGNDEFVGSEPVTREEAALYSFNMIQADLVRYDAKTTVDVNGATVTIAGDKAEAIPQNGSGYKDTMGDNDVVQFAEKSFPKLSKTGNKTDDFGRPANEWKYRSEIIGTYTNYSDMIGEWSAKATKGELYSLIGSGIIDDLAGEPVSGEYGLSFWVDGEQVNVGGRDGNNNPDAASETAKDYFFDRNSSSASGIQNAVNRGTNVGMSGNGVLTQVFMDDDNNVTIVMINTYLVQATADYNSTKETITVEAIDTDETVKANYNDMVLPTGMDTSIDQEDFDVSGVKEGDYLLVTWSVDADAYQSVTPAELVTGTVSEYTERDSVVLNGEKLSYARLTGDTEQEEQFSINSEAALVLDAYGYILYVDDANSTSSYVFVNGIQGKTNLNKDAVADAYFTDGTDGEIDIKKLYDEAGKSYDSGKAIINAYNEPGWYTFTKDSNDEYTLTAVKDFENTSKRYEDSVVVKNGDNGQIVYSSSVYFLGDDANDDRWVGDDSDRAPRANADTLFMVLDADETVTVYSGVANAPDVTLSAADKTALVTYVVDTNGYAKYVFIDVSNDPDANIDGDAVADYMFVLWDNGKRTFVEGDEYRQYQVIIDGEETTRMIAESLVGGNNSSTGKVFYDIKVNDKDYITDNTKIFEDHTIGNKDEHVVLTLNGDTITQKGGTITFGGDSFLADANTEIHMNVRAKALMKDNGNNYESYVNTTIGTIAGLCTNYEVDATVYVVLDDDFGKTDRADFIFVDITAGDKIDTSAIPALERTGDKNDTYAAGDDARLVEFDVSVDNEGNMTYTVNNGSSDIKTGSVSDGDTISFYPTDDGAAGDAEDATYTVTVKNVVDGKTYTTEETVVVKVGDAVVTALALEKVSDGTSVTSLTVNSGADLGLSNYFVVATMSDTSEETYLASAVENNLPDSGKLVWSDTDNGVFNLKLTYGGKTLTIPVTVTAAIGSATADNTDGTSDDKMTVTSGTGGSATFTVTAGTGSEIVDAVEANATSGITCEWLNSDKTLLKITVDATVAANTYTVNISAKGEAGTVEAAAETITITVS